MATKNVLPTNYQDDIVATSMGGKRRYKIINNSDGTISLEDVTEYTQVGSDFNAKNINATNTAINACYSSTEVDNKLGAKIDTSKIENNAYNLLNATDTSKVAGAVGIKGLKSLIPTSYMSSYSGDLNSLGTGTFECKLWACKNYPSNIPTGYATVISYSNALQILIPNGTSSTTGDFVAFRRYQNYAWQNWVVVGGTCGFNDAYKCELLVDATGVDFDNPYGKNNRTMRVERGHSCNLPKNCQYGVREVTWVYKNWVILRITGVDTGGKTRMWIAQCKDGVWTTWSMLTEGFDRGVANYVQCGSWVLHPESGVTSILLMTNSDIANLLGISNVTNHNTAIFINNGDGDADNTHYEGCTYKGGGWYVTFDRAQTRPNIRINWMIVHWDDGEYREGANEGVG